MRNLLRLGMVAVCACRLVAAGEPDKTKGPFPAKTPVNPKNDKLWLKKAAERKDAFGANEAARKTAKILKTRKTSFDFVDAPLGDALGFVREVLGVNLIVGPDVDQRQPLTLRAQDMIVGSALQWMAKLVGAKMEITPDGAIFITGAPPAAAKGKALHPKLLARAKKPLVRKGGGLMVAKAQLKLGGLGMVELYFYEGDLDPEAREIFSRLLRTHLARELEQIEAKHPRRRREDAIGDEDAPIDPDAPRRRKGKPAGPGDEEPPPKHGKGRL